MGLIGPGKPITDVPASNIDGVVDAADDAFVEGIRAALAAAAGLVGLTLVAGFVFFPKGRRVVVDEEADALAAGRGGVEVDGGECPQRGAPGRQLGVRYGRGDR